jgi:hypothetical protein
MSAGRISEVAHDRFRRIVAYRYLGAGTDDAASL